MLSSGRLGTGKNTGKPKVLDVLERLKRAVLLDWHGKEHREADLTVWTKVRLSSTGMLRLYRILSRAMMMGSGLAIGEVFQLLVQGRLGVRAGAEGNRLTLLTEGWKG